MKKIVPFTFVLLWALFIALPASGQDQQQGSENSLLPEIDPQDIEIRSQFKAQFPGLRRQPILGFDPTPRVYQIDPNRTPYLEDRDQAVADLEVSNLSRPAPPEYTPFHYSSDINAFARMGIGSYLSPEAQFWGVSRISDKSYVGGNFDYSSSDGHLQNQASSFRFVDANGQFVTKLSSEGKLSFTGGYANSFNQLPNYGSGGPIPDNARKTYSGFRLGAGFDHHKNTVTGWKVRANVRYFNTGLDNAGSLLTQESEERVFNISVAKQWAGSHPNEVFTIKGGTNGGNYEHNTSSGIINDSWITARGGVGYERLFNYQTQLSADAQIFYIDNPFRDNIYFGPSVVVEQTITDMLSVKLQAKGRPTVTTLEDHQTQNRFLGTDDRLQHSYRINGSAEVQVAHDKLGSLDVGIRYENTSNDPVYARDRNNLGTSVLDFYGIAYLDTYTIGAYANATHQLVPERLWFDAKIYWQSPKVQGGGRTPYEEKVGISSTFRARFFDRLTIELWGDYIGSRETFRTNSTLSGYVITGSRAEMNITKNVGAYVKFVNILNQDYQVWQGYAERPFQVYGGLTVKL
ncbi:hypothetical protein [Fodinibius salinus]|nr:hypothetical protein [Fodinibius salinus]